MDYGVFIIGWVGGTCFGLFLGIVTTFFSLALYFHVFWYKKLEKILKPFDFVTKTNTKELSEITDKKGFSFSEGFGDIMKIMRQAQKDAQ